MEAQSFHPVVVKEGNEGMYDNEPEITIKRVMPHIPKWTEEEIEYFKWGMVKTRYMTKEEIEKEFGVKIK